MTSRRDFVKAIGAAGLAGMGASAAGCRRAETGRHLDRIGMQLYTVRGSMEDDVEGTLARVAEIGYHEVEFAGYFGRPPAQIRRALDDTGLGAPAVHTALDLLETAWEPTVDAAAQIGHRYLVVPSIPPERRRTLDDYRRIAERFNALAGRARAAGLGFAYHNHAFEFEQLEERTPYDILLDETDPTLVGLELDLYWISSAGRDPLAYLRGYPGRFPFVHVKDMAADGSMVAVGAGTIDFAAVFALSDVAGIAHYFVEHDNPADPFESLAASYRYLRGLTY